MLSFYSDEECSQEQESVYNLTQFLSVLHDIILQSWKPILFDTFFFAYVAICALAGDFSPKHMYYICVARWQNIIKHFIGVSKLLTIGFK